MPRDVNGKYTLPANPDDWFTDIAEALSDSVARADPGEIDGHLYCGNYAILDSITTAKAFCWFSAKTTQPKPHESGSFNVKSITYNDVGDYTIHFHKQISTSAYVIAGTAETVNGKAVSVCIHEDTAPSQNSVRINVLNGNNDPVDSHVINVVVFAAV
jgi:hypothetical protein